MPEFPTIPPPAKRLLIFARLPERGRVKSRLAAEIGEERALAAYEAMLHDALTAVGAPAGDQEFEVLWAPTEAANGESLARAFHGLPVAMQTGADIGERMAMAFAERFYFHRTKQIVVAGVDDPRLSRDLVDHAFALLDSCDWVIAPAADGGYTLIGCRAAVFDSEVFRGIEWGSASVFAATIAKIRAAQRNLAVLPLRRDLDTASDLRRHAAAGAGGELGKVLASWGWDTRRPRSR